MATVNKDFKVKNGLVVEGTTATVDNYDVLTKKPDDQNYIIGLIGGSATPNADPDTVVLRDENADFSANMITSDLTGDVTGTVSDISNHDTDDLSEGTTNKYYTDGRVKDVLVNSTKTNIQITEIAGELHITAENGVADSTTDDLTEGTLNKYFTDTRAKDAVSAALGTGIEYTNGSFDVQLGTGLETDGSNQIQIDRNTVDGWYDASGTASGLVDDHNVSSNVHGVTGNVVGTTDSQTLSNKTLDGQIYFGYDNTNASYIQGEVDGAGNLTVHAGNDLTLSTNSGDIVLNPDGTAYVGSASAGNEIATNSYVDNAVAGLNWKQAVNLLWDDTQITMSGSTGTLALDGHSALTSADDGYRILTINMGSDNGIWVYSDNGTNWSISRAADADTYEELVGAAVFVMEGTQYNNTSWVQSNHYITNFTGQSWTQFSGTGSVVAGNGIVVDGLEVSIDTNVVATQTDLSTGLGTKQDTLSAGDGIYIDGSNQITSRHYGGGGLKFVFSEAAIDRNTVDGWYDASGAAATAEDNANSYTDNQLENYTPTSNLESTIDGYGFAYTSEIPTSTDDITEGTFNHYYTDGRAEDAAGNLLANATKSNIQITYNAGALTITAENGVDDATTDDLDEGSTNLYFTDQRAVDALENVIPNFTEIDINSVARQIAAQTGNIATASTNTVYQFAKADYRSAKFLIKCAYGSHTELTEVLLTLDSSDNIAITEYATVGTNGSTMDVSADIDMGNVRLRVATVNNNSVVTVTGTLLA